jgi:hypothetical protein
MADNSTNFVDERLDHYVRLFEKIRGKVGDDQLAVALVDQCGKDWRVAQMREREAAPREQAANGEAPATPKQLAFLESLNVKQIPRGLSKADASRMIDEAQRAMEV